MRVARFLDELDRYDTAYYLELLDRAVKEVLSPWEDEVECRDTQN